MSKEKELWDIVTSILDTHGDNVDSISIHEYTDFCTEKRKIYCSQGYCFELERIESDEETTSDVEDGFVYCFSEPWDGFEEAGINEAINILIKYM